MQDVYKCGSTAAITLSSWTSSKFSSVNDKYAELNSQFPLGIDLNKILAVVRMKAEKTGIHFSKHTGT